MPFSPPDPHPAPGPHPAPARTLALRPSTCAEWHMATITFRGTPVQTVGELPAVGTKAPAFTLTGADLADVTSDASRVSALSSTFSPAWTPACAPLRCASLTSAQRLSIMPWWCAPPPIYRLLRDDSVRRKASTVWSPARSFRSSFGSDYGVTQADGPLAGVLARAVVVLDTDGTVLYTELVPEIGQSLITPPLSPRFPEFRGPPPRGVRWRISIGAARYG